MKFKVLLKWTLIVWINAAFSFLVSLNEFPRIIDRIGIICGVLSFAIIYTAIDIHLLNLKKFQLRKVLLISAFVKALFQIDPVLELWAGVASFAFVDWIIGEIAFISSYLITLADGFLLSLLVAVISFLINFVMNKYSKKTNPVSQAL